MIAESQLRQLNSLYKELLRRHERLVTESAKSAREAHRLKDENLNLREQLRRFSTAASRHERIKNRLAKISKKLEQFGLS